jgi:iron complex transport system ATP-binding protein
MQPLVKLEHVSLSRGHEPILHDISWTVGRGENWALIGANGAGKSTLLNIIAGYLWPSAGTVAVMGEVFGQVDLRELRKSIGWVSISLGDWFAAHHGDNTVLQVVASGKDASIGVPYKNISKDTTDLSYQALRNVRLDDKASRPFSVLSQGERQRVLLARTHMAAFQLLILDEPCTGLDIPSRELLLDSIEELAQRQELSLIYVTHHVEELRSSFTHGLLLERGRVARRGALNTVITNESLSNAFGIAIEVQWDYGRPWVKVAHKEYSS